jgi:FlaA1/EpsC-like NDP-sugar epimerase
MSVLAIPAISTPAHKEHSLAGWVFVFVDAVALELALLLGVFVRQAIPFHPVAITPDQYKGVAFGLLMIPLAYYLMGLYPGYGTSEVQRLKNRVDATVLAFALLIGWDYIVQERLWSRGILLATLIFALVLPPVAVSYARHWLTKLGWCGAPVLILGAGRTGALVARTLREQPSLGFVPVAFYDDDPVEMAFGGRGLKGTRTVGCGALFSGECPRRRRRHARTGARTPDGSGSRAVVPTHHRHPRLVRNTESVD